MLVPPLTRPYIWSRCTNLIAILLFAILMICGSRAQATSYSWNGSKSTAWSEALNWTPNGVPSATDSVAITTGTVSLEGSSLSIKRLLLSRGVLTGGSLSLTETSAQSEWTGGTISCILNIKSNVPFSIQQGTLTGTINNEGIVTWGLTDQSFTILLGTGATFNNNGGGIFNARFAGYWGDSSNGVSEFNNYGTFNRQTRGTTIFGNKSNFNNLGTVSVTEGTLELGGGRSTSTFDVGLNGKLLFERQRHTLTSDAAHPAGARFTGAGVSQIGQGTVEIVGSIVGGANGGSFHATAGLLTTAPEGGTITGKLTLGEGGHLGGDLHIADGATAQWVNSGVWGSSVWSRAGSSFTVEPGATFNVSGMQTSEWGAENDNATFNMRGVFNHPEFGSTVFRKGVRFNQNGTVNVSMGLLSITSGTATGTFNTTAPGWVSISGDIYTLTGGVQFVGGGDNALSGTVIIDGKIAGAKNSGRLRLSDFGTLTTSISGGTITGAIDLKGGTLKGTLNIADGGIARLSANKMTADAGSVFNVLKGGTFYVQGSGSWEGISNSTSSFNLAGTLLQDENYVRLTFAPGINFNNSGVVNVEAGELYITNGTSSGAFNCSTGAIIQFTDGTHVLTADLKNPTGAKFGGTANTQIAAGTVKVNGLVEGGNLEVAGGTLTSVPTGATFSKGIHFRSGFIAGKLTVARSATATWAEKHAGDSMHSETGSELNINYGATFNVSSNSVWFNTGSGSQNINIKGTLNRSGNNTNSRFDLGINLNNSGTINGEQGILEIADGTSTGVFNSTASGRIRFTQGTHTLTSGAKFTGAGTTDITTGMVKVSGAIVGGTSGGTLQLKGGTLSTAPAGAAINGSLLLTGGNLTGNLTFNSGAILTWSGTGDTANINTATNSVLTVASGAVFNALASAKWRNGGTGGQNLRMFGTMNLAAPGTTTIGIPFTLNAVSLINAKLKGATPVTEFDQLVLEGPTVALNGSLIVTSLNNYVPTVGTSYKIIRHSGTRAGNFAFVNSPFKATYEADGVSISTLSSPALLVTVNPQTFSEIALRGSVMGTVTRTGPTTSAQTVTLANSNPGRLTIPTSVKIPAGAISATFIVAPVNTAIVEGNALAIVTASASGMTSGTTRVSIVEDDLARLNPVITPLTFLETAPDGTITGTISRNTLLNTSVAVRLSSSRAQKVLLSTADAPTPAQQITVIIPVGSVSASFNVHAVDNFIKDGSAYMSITATASGFVNGSRTLTVTDNDTGILGLTVNTPTSVKENASEDGTPGTTATLKLVVANPSPTIVTVTSANANKVTFPGATIDSSGTLPKATIQVTIPANTLQANFDILAINNELADGNFPAAISANAMNYATVTRSVTIVDDDARSLILTVTPSTVAEDYGVGATATITRNTTQNWNAALITVTSSNANKVTFAGATINNAVSPPVATTTVTIPASAVSVELPLIIVDNAVIEGNATVSLKAALKPYVNGTATITVTDNESAIGFRRTPSPVPSGGSS